MPSQDWTRLGRYRALVAPAGAGLDEALIDLDALLARNGEVLQAGRHITRRLRVGTTGASYDLVVKTFGRQSIIKDAFDRLFGSKALRTFLAASFMRDRGIGTVPPIACLEEWRGPRLVSSHFVSLHIGPSICFTDRLSEVWSECGDGTAFTPLLALVADAVRKLHDAGCAHGDLGNQNIELLRGDVPGTFSGVAFLDLNRARFGKPLSIAARACDLARISLPVGLYDDFFRLYWSGSEPHGFRRAYRLYRFLFSLHGLTRPFRHPLREMRYRQHPETAPAQAGYPVRLPASASLPEGRYTDARGRGISRSEAAALPRGTTVYRFATQAAERQPQ